MEDFRDPEGVQMGESFLGLVYEFANRVYNIFICSM